MKTTRRGVDFVAIDGGEGGTGAAPLSFADHVSLPFKIGFGRLDPHFDSRTASALFGYDPGWGLPSRRDREEVCRVMGVPGPPGIGRRDGGKGRGGKRKRSAPARRRQRPRRRRRAASREA